FFEPFEKETGIKVIPAADVPVGAIRTSVIAGAPVYDVVDISGGEVDGMVRDNMLEKIDYSLFRPGDTQNYTLIPAGEYTPPSISYSLVMAYDEGAFGANPPTTWADMWNVARFPGKRALYDAGTDIFAGAVFETALMADGVDPKSLYPIDFTR